jgi:hypothetical protein
MVGPVTLQLTEGKMNRDPLRKAALLFSWAIFVTATLAASATTWHVGPARTYTTPCNLDRAGVVANGDTIIIDYSPSTGPGVGYYDDTCNWTNDNLTLIGVPNSGGARPVLNTAGLTDTATTGHISGYKGIWVISGNGTVIENLEFENAMISNDDGANGAGIRMQGVNLTVLNCYFHDNQDGILESNVAGSNIVIKYSEFAHNGVSDPSLSEGYGQTHNLYIGHCASLLFAFNYSHDANVGHLLKTRAAVNYILYSRLTGENGTDSYEMDIPNGGTSYVIGNLIEKGPNSQNDSRLLTYLEEGPNASNPGTDLYVVNNSFVNQYPSSPAFVGIGNESSVEGTPALIQNNIFYGLGTATNETNAVLRTNFAGNPDFVSLTNYDYHLTAGSPAINAGSQPTAANGFDLAPKFEYVHPACGQNRHPVGIIDIGAYEFGDGGPMLQCR